MREGFVIPKWLGKQTARRSKPHHLWTRVVDEKHGSHAEYENTCLRDHSGIQYRAICDASWNGIFAIAADAALRALLFDPVVREIDGCEALNQSPPCFMCS